MKLIDLSGQKFGRLTVMERGKNTDRGEATWRCKCKCGSETVVRSDCLRRGDTKSCGCLAKEKRANRRCQVCKRLKALSEYAGRKGRVCSSCQTRKPASTGGRKNKKREIVTEADDLALKMARMKW